jgi:hypothetical protein
MNFNVNAMFQAQIAQIATFFEGPKRRFVQGSTESKEKARIKGDEFILSHPLVDVDDIATDNDIHHPDYFPFHYLKRNKDGWR